MKFILGTLLMWGISAPVFLPWLLARLGYYKRWYLAPFAPPIMWGKAIYGWPISLFFLVGPLVALLGIKGDLALTIMSWLSILSIVLAFLMLLWTPRWAKPQWQLYLEDNHSYQEIRQVFIPAWRKMDRHEWSQLLDSESGIRKLVRIAQEQQPRQES